MAKIKKFNKSTKSGLVGVDTSRHIAGQHLIRKFVQGAAKRAERADMMKIMEREK